MAHCLLAISSFRRGMAWGEQDTASKEWSSRNSIFSGLAPCSPQMEICRSGRHILPLLQGNDRLPGATGSLGQLLLGHLFVLEAEPANLVLDLSPGHGLPVSGPPAGWTRHERSCRKWRWSTPQTTSTPPALLRGRGASRKARWPAERHTATS